MPGIDFLGEKSYIDKWLLKDIQHHTLPKFKSINKIANQKGQNTL